MALSLWRGCMPCICPWPGRTLLPPCIAELRRQACDSRAADRIACNSLPRSGRLLSVPPSCWAPDRRGCFLDRLDGAQGHRPEHARPLVVQFHPGVQLAIAHVAAQVVDGAGLVAFVGIECHAVAQGDLPRRIGQGGQHCGAPFSLAVTPHTPKRSMAASITSPLDAATSKNSKRSVCVRTITAKVLMCHSLHGVSGRERSAGDTGRR